MGERRSVLVKEGWRCLGNSGYNPGGFTSIVGVVVVSELELVREGEYSLELISMFRSPRIRSTKGRLSDSPYL